MKWEDCLGEWGNDFFYFFFLFLCRYRPPSLSILSFDSLFLFSLSILSNLTCDTLFCFVYINIHSDFDAGNGRGIKYERLASLIDAAFMTKKMFSLRYCFFYFYFFLFFFFLVHSSIIPCQIIFFFCLRCGIPDILWRILFCFYSSSYFVEYNH